MTAPSIIFGVGATKAGTSWLWEYLAAHPGVSARRVKELHYFDTFEKGARVRQLEGFSKVRLRLTDKRRIADLDALCDVIDGDRTGDVSYARFVAGEGASLDVTPSYGLLTADGFSRMQTWFPAARFVYLVRDPVERLWSHIRMEVKRRMQPGADFDNRARGMLNRIVDEGGEPQIVVRGNYALALTRLVSAVPAEQLHVAVSEEMTDEAGVRDLCAFAGLEYVVAPKVPVHVGTRSEMHDGMRNRAARFLRDQYDFMAEFLGRIPAAWQANYERAVA